MAYSTQRATSDGTLAYLDLTIGYISRADISVFYNGLPANPSTWSWAGTTDKRINFSPVIAAGVQVLLVRKTQINGIIHVFSLGAKFNNSTMDQDFTQLLYLNQEAVEGAALTDIFTNVDFHGNRITNLGDATSDLDGMNRQSVIAVTATQVTAAAASATASAASAVLSANYRDASQTYSLTSRDWATKLVDPVDGTDYSSHYWANAAAASAASIALPPATGQALNYIRQNASATGFEYRTPAQVLSAIGAFPIVGGTATGPIRTDRYVVGVGANPIFLTQPSAPDGTLELRLGDGTTAGTLIKRLDVPVVSTEQVTTSGLLKDFTGIPAWAKRVTVSVNGISLSGAADVILQIGAGSVIATGYVGGASQSGATSSSTTQTAGMQLGIANSAGFSRTGVATLVKIGSGNTWVMAFGGSRQTDGYGLLGSSVLTLGGALDRVRLTTTNGTDTFDAGSVNIMYE